MSSGGNLIVGAPYTTLLHLKLTNPLWVNQPLECGASQPKRSPTLVKKSTHNVYPFMIGTTMSFTSKPKMIAVNTP